jgi:phytoene dehydrogenase-like protein
LEEDAVQSRYDAVVVGSGPNGLAAAVTLARAGLSVAVFEGAKTAGGGMRSDRMTLPGYIHDVCSSIHPMAAGSPFFRSLPLEEHGLTWLTPPTSVAHPFDDGTAVTLERSIEVTAAQMEDGDAQAYSGLMTPFVSDWETLVRDALGPPKLPRNPVLLARFGMQALRSARGIADGSFKGYRSRGLLGGLAAHSMLPLERRPSAAFMLILGMLGHAVGWPVAKGGSQAIADALVSYLRSLGGEVVTDNPIRSIDDLPPAQAVLFDVTPRQLLRLAGHRLPRPYRHTLARYRYGLGAFKLDWALDGPIPWKAEACHRASTVHVGGTLEEIATSEAAAWRGEHPRRPFVLVGQPSVLDPTRAPRGKHTAWGYCHVPNGSMFDMIERIESQVERFAPGFRERIIARSVMGPANLEEHDPNLVGGDIVGGVQDLGQLFARPSLRPSPYKTPLAGVYICSASTPPGGGVHGLCGWHAAQAALRDMD